MGDLPYFPTSFWLPPPFPSPFMPATQARYWYDFHSGTESSQFPLVALY